MLPKPSANLTPNTLPFEMTPLVKPTGFREYDARWWFGHPGSAEPPELNLMGVQALGMGLGTLIHEFGVKPHVVTGHDFRAYSMAIKIALTQGLMAAGCTVHDIGLAMSPMAYFAQFALDIPVVAMVTASHNENGWTGVKMGAERPVTFGPDEMARLRDIVLSGGYKPRRGGAYRFRREFCRHLCRRSNPASALQTTDQGGRGLRQRHGGGFCSAYPEGSGRRCRPARCRARSHVSRTTTRTRKT